MTAAPTLPLSHMREARRAGNLERSSFVTRLRCECAIPGCQETFPVVAEPYRGSADRFIVVPAHLGGIVAAVDIHDGTVVRAADRFLVVDLNENAGRFPVTTGPRTHDRLQPPSWSSVTSRPWAKR